MTHDAKIKQALKLMQSNGGKFKNMKEAVTKLAPLIGAKTLFEAFRNIPILGDIMKGIDDVQAWVVKNTLGNIPILKWNYAMKEAAKNYLSGGDKSITDYVNEPKPEGQEQESSVKEEGNSKTWYIDALTDGKELDFPTNIMRDMSYDKSILEGNANYSTIYGIPKLCEVVLSPWDLLGNRKINTKVTSIFEVLRGNLKSNINYNEDQIKVWLFNNISLYAIAKHLERKLCMRNYDDDQINTDTWKALWQNIDLPVITQGDALHTLNVNANFDPTFAEFSDTLKLYDELCKEGKYFVLPSNFKSWIDHYFGSVFTVDDEVANRKYLYLRLDYVNMYGISDGEIYSYKLNVSQYTKDVAAFIDLMNSFFNNRLYNTIKTDFTNGVGYPKEKWSITNYTTGWLTKYNEYVPTVIKDPGLVQALINGYTSNVAEIMYNLTFDHKVRLDSIDDYDDHLTTILFLGDLIKQSPRTLKYPTQTLSILCVNMLIYASADLPVAIPTVMSSGNIILSNVEESGSSNQVELLRKPFAITFTSDNLLKITSVNQIFDEENYAYTSYFTTFIDTVESKELISYFEPLGSISFPLRYLSYNLDGNNSAVSTKHRSIDNVSLIIPLCALNDNRLVFAVSKSSFNLDEVYEKKLNSFGANFNVYVDDPDREYTVGNVPTSLRTILTHPFKDESSQTCFMITDGLANDLRDNATQIADIPGDVLQGFGISIFNVSIKRTNPFWTVDFNVGGTAALQRRSDDDENHDFDVVYDSLNVMLYPTYQRYITSSYSDYPLLRIQGQMFKEYFYNAFGYFIPLVTRLGLYTTAMTDSESAGVHMYDTAVLNITKEDFLPYTVCIDDLPPIIYDMYDGLFSMAGVNNKGKIVEKNE